MVAALVSLVSLLPRSCHASEGVREGGREGGVEGGREGGSERGRERASGREPATTELSIHLTLSLAVVLAPLTSPFKGRGREGETMPKIFALRSTLMEVHQWLSTSDQERAIKESSHPFWKKEDEEDGKENLTLPIWEDQQQQTSIESQERDREIEGRQDCFELSSLWVRNFCQI